MTALSLRGLRGGVGTSSLLAATGYALHSLGERVLLVDMCPENLLRLHFSVSFGERGGWARAMIEGKGWNTQAWTVEPGLSVLPYGRLKREEQDHIEQRLLNEPNLWRRRQATLAEHFDWILFDVPLRLPGHACVGPCALRLQIVEADAACHVLLQQEEDPREHLLINRFDPVSQLQRDLLLIWRKQYGARLLPLNVHQDEAMREAQAFKMPVGAYAQASLVAQDVLSLATWCLTQRMGTA
ncbi:MULTISPECIES: cellulose biosynthesis protein BcsQ [unclassified Pseudomonas]|uniref:cellulose biosynthesis protein BcsQ n=1 Tax=unclassified Pseudomonas TaxID=196821 RepID=UPI00035534BB|nr:MULTISPECIES: cellulose biosynthesis protein BcsQ [unclassified Pseudomonas]EPJ78367.1 putative cellulose synthase [Pseudomonas sp. CFII68]OOG85292.1 cellulose synthase operon protein YhjQ [Pseudomonas sp. A25(2017)]